MRINGNKFIFCHLSCVFIKNNVLFALFEIVFESLRVTITVWTLVNLKINSEYPALYPIESKCSMYTTSRLTVTGDWLTTTRRLTGNVRNCVKSMKKSMKKTLKTCDFCLLS